MNPIFSSRGESWEGYPRRSYARLDQTEPTVRDRNGDFVVALDAVDAEWFGFAPGGYADLRDVAGIHQRQDLFWSHRFAHKEPKVDPFEKMPIYRIEITVRPNDPYHSELVALTEDAWLAVSLTEPRGGQQVDVFGGLLAAPVTADLQKIEMNIPEKIALNATFSMEAWPDATGVEIQESLSSVQSLEYLIALDVGQGSAIALADANKHIQLYFDLGGGVYRNAPTRPVPLRFCWIVDAPVILSHWDSDHWAGEIGDPSAQKRTWVAPRQNITPTHVAFANRILAAGGNLLIWGNNSSNKMSFSAGGQTLTLSKCTGVTRNGSGIAATVTDSGSGKDWLLTGDAGYHQLLTIPAHPTAVVVPHHGADMGPSSVPPSNPGGYVRLIYSFGPGNRHGRTNVQHPTLSAVSAHAAWNHGAWFGVVPGSSVANGDILATAQHPKSHLESAAVGWSAAPNVPLGSFPHATPTSSTGCTSKVIQA